MNQVMRGIKRVLQERGTLKVHTRYLPEVLALASRGLLCLDNGGQVVGSVIQVSKPIEKKGRD